MTGRFCQRGARSVHSAASIAALKLPNRLRMVFSAGVIRGAAHECWSGMVPCRSVNSRRPCARGATGPCSALIRSGRQVRAELLSDEGTDLWAVAGGRSPGRSFQPWLARRLSAYLVHDPAGNAVLLVAD